MSPRLLLLRLLRRWHARIGFAAMLFFLILAVSGLALNHGQGLGLDGRFVHAEWLARYSAARAYETTASVVNSSAKRYPSRTLNASPAFEAQERAMRR